MSKLGTIVRVTQGVPTQGVTTKFFQATLVVVNMGEDVGFN